MADLNAANVAITNLYTRTGKRIAAARQAREYTQVDLACAIGLSRSAVGNIESGAQRAPFHILLGIAQALAVDPAELLLGDEPPQIVPPLPVVQVPLRRRLLAARTEIDTLLEALPDTYDKGANA